MTEFMNFEGPTFTMQVPTNWFITSSPTLQAVFVAPTSVAGNQPVRPNIIVSIRRLKEETAAQTVAAAVKKDQQTQYADYQILKEIDNSADDISGFSRQYTWHKTGENTRVVQTQTFYVARKILYTLTGTRSADVEIPVIDEIFTRMSNSFKVHDFEDLPEANADQPINP